MALELKDMTEEQRARHDLACLAIGRILRICSRPFQEGDIEEYERCKAIVMDCHEKTLGVDVPYGWTLVR